MLLSNGGGAYRLQPIAPAMPCISMADNGMNAAYLRSNCAESSMPDAQKKCTKMPPGV